MQLPLSYGPRAVAVASEQDSCQPFVNSRRIGSINVLSGSERKVIRISTDSSSDNLETIRTAPPCSILPHEAFSLPLAHGRGPFMSQFIV